jgi:hypothetical protein
MKISEWNLTGRKNGNVKDSNKVNAWCDGRLERRQWCSNKMDQYDYTSRIIDYLGTRIKWIKTGGMVQGVALLPVTKCEAKFKPQYNPKKKGSWRHVQ